MESVRPSGRRWNPLDIADSSVVDTAEIGPLTVEYGDSGGPGFDASVGDLPAKAGEPDCNRLRMRSAGHIGNTRHIGVMCNVTEPYRFVQLPQPPGLCASPGSDHHPLASEPEGKRRGDEGFPGKTRPW